MQEIQVKNELGMSVYINGATDIRQIPKEIADSILSALELRISEDYKSEQNDKTTEF